MYIVNFLVDVKVYLIKINRFIFVIEGNIILEIAVFVSFFKCIANENK